MKAKLSWVRYYDGTVRYRLACAHFELQSKVYKSEGDARNGLTTMLKRLRTEGLEVKG